MRYLRIVFLLLLLLPCVLMAQRSDEKTIRDFCAMGVPFYERNDVNLLPTAMVKFEDMFRAIRQAEKYVHLDYFKFQEDSICNELFRLLRTKVQEGVEVKIVYDAVGNKYSDKPLTKKFLKTQRQAGIQIEAFDPFRFPWIHHLFHRNHHKITIVDGKIAYTGGMNVADYYIHGKPKIGKWRDMHIQVEGPIVAGYQEIFDEMWARITDREVQTPVPGSSASVRGDMLVALVDRVPRQSPSVMRDAYCACIDNAQHLIQIVNPYATLISSLRSSLYAALERGVRVQFMVSTTGDGPVTSNVMGIEMKKLIKRGAEVYDYDDGFHHSKFMMIDSLFCTIGTANLDARSLRFDYEVNAFIFDRGVTAELQKIFSTDVREHCTLLTIEEWKKRFTLKRRLSGRLFGIAKGLL